MNKIQKQIEILEKQLQEVEQEERVIELKNQIANIKCKIHNGLSKEQQNNNIISEYEMSISRLRIDNERNLENFNKAINQLKFLVRNKNNVIFHLIAVILVILFLSSTFHIYTLKNIGDICRINAQNKESAQLCHNMQTKPIASYISKMMGF